MQFPRAAPPSNFRDGLIRGILKRRRERRRCAITSLELDDDCCQDDGEVAVTGKTLLIPNSSDIARESMTRCEDDLTTIIQIPVAELSEVDLDKI